MLFIVILVLVILGIVWWENNHKPSFEHWWSAVIIVVSVFFLLSALFHMDNRESDRKFVKEYMFVQKYIYSDAIDEDFRQELRIRAHNLNVQIDWNKKNLTSVWFGIWASDIKANAEKIFIIDGLGPYN